MKVVWLHRLLPVLACSGMGCTESDDRPPTLPYITEAVLVPTCGLAQCHSAFGSNSGYVFDSVVEARRTIHRKGLAIPDDATDPNNAGLIVWVTQRDPFGLGVGRMPYDAPLPNEDVVLFKKWIEGNVKGAQCVPEDNGGKECGFGANSKAVYACDADGNLGPTPVMTCPSVCSNGACL